MSQLEKLHKLGISFIISSLPWAGFEWYLGDGCKNVLAQGTTSSLLEAKVAIWNEALKHYPDAECFKEGK